MSQCPMRNVMSDQTNGHAMHQTVFTFFTLAYRRLPLPSLP